MGATYGTGFGYYKNGGLSYAPISYVRYNGRFQTTQYLTNDLDWQKSNTTYFDYSIVGVTPLLDPADETKLLTQNFWGNLNRATNDLGGTVFDGSDGSTNAYLVDNYTGLGWYLQTPILGGDNWIDSANTITTLTIADYGSWRMLAKFDAINILTTDGSTNILEDNGASYGKDSTYLLDSNSATEVGSWLRVATDYLSSTLFQLVDPNTSFASTGSIICRNHF
jgi:hypothetical protein